MNAKENPSWGFDWIQGALANVGYLLSEAVVCAPRRRPGRAVQFNIAYEFTPAENPLAYCSFRESTLEVCYKQAAPMRLGEPTYR